MFPSNTLLSLIFIALSAVDATPLSRRSGKPTLRFSTNINKRDAFNVTAVDRARAINLNQASQFSKRGEYDLDIASNGISYTAQVGIGNPPIDYTLLIDSGSANTFIGLNKTYTKTSTSHDTGNTVAMKYGSGNWTGKEWIDTVTLAPHVVINRQSIGVAENFTGFNVGFDGILGVGPVDLTQHTVNNTKTVPTVLDNLLSQETISEEVLGVYFKPASERTSDGELTFGGHDKSVITSAVNYVPITKASLPSKYWGIDQSIEYDGTTILSSAAGIVDTGTTIILLATDAFQKYQNATGATLDPVVGLLRITDEQYSRLKPLTFNIGSKSYDLTPNGQIWPRSLNTIIGGNSSSIYLNVGDLGDFGGVPSEMKFILGYTFLERYYSVFDTTNRRVGFASTRYTKSESN